VPPAASRSQFEAGKTTTADFMRLSTPHAKVALILYLPLVGRSNRGSDSGGGCAAARLPPPEKREGRFSTPHKGRSRAGLARVRSPWANTSPIGVRSRISRSLCWRGVFSHISFTIARAFASSRSASSMSMTLPWRTSPTARKPRRATRGRSLCPGDRARRSQRDENARLHVAT